MAGFRSRSHDPGTVGVRTFAEAALFYLAPIADDGPFPDWRPELDEVPLVAPTVAGSGIAIATGIKMGPVLVEVGGLPDDPGNWEEHGSTQVHIREPLVSAVGGHEPITMFSPAAAGHYRVDVYAVNREINRDLARKPKARKNLERYLVVFTPIQQPAEAPDAADYQPPR
ncbi:MAG: hypothetical protein QM619_10240 [Micropruina sp.]|uniref:hypothetical protein n=1 Tax=Micropruina sp. TaxID=2737536 RepID=UPI0039E37E66